MALTRRRSFPRSLIERFEQLKRRRAPQRRWASFEKLISEVLTRDGFKVTLNAGAAKPRQTDLFAMSNNLSLVVEVKWQTRKLDVADIASMRDRLRRVPADIVGLIVSASEYTEPALAEVQTDRTREILLVTPAEVNALFAEDLNALQLVQRKREALRRDGKVWFHQQRHRSKRLRLPKTDRKILNLDGSVVPSIFGRTENAHVHFSLQQPDTSWHTFGTAGVAIDIRLDVNTPDDIQHVLEMMHERFGLSKEGTFAIEQITGAWLGIGASDFVREIKARDRRYREHTLSYVHHSEHLSYFDSLRDGWLLLLARQAAGSSRHRNSIDSGQLYIQLPGVPVDANEFADLCRELRDPHARFHILKRPAAYHVRLRQPIKLDVRMHIVEPSSGWICALGVANPFFRSKKLPKELTEEGDAPFHSIGE